MFSAHTKQHLPLQCDKRRQEEPESVYRIIVRLAEIVSFGVSQETQSQKLRWRVTEGDTQG